MFVWPLLLIGLLVWLSYAIGKSTRASAHERVREVEQRREGSGRDAR